MNVFEMRAYKEEPQLHDIIEKIKNTYEDNIEVHESDLYERLENRLKSLGYTVEYNIGEDYNYYIVSGW